MVAVGLDSLFKLLHLFIGVGHFFLRSFLFLIPTGHVADVRRFFLGAG